MQAESRVSDLVVVGASAGGIDALVRLTSGLTRDFPAPIVVAQHLDPHRASHLQEILARHCPLPIETVAALVALRPGVLYLVPANRHVEITDHSVRVLRNSRRGGPRPSIDLLFESAAQRFGEHLIAVVLSGTGTDGAAGARAVYEAGGTVVIQNPETAAFPGMPRSLAPVTVHITADAERIGPILADLLTGDSSSREPEDDRALRTLLDYLRGRHGVDFGSYRRPTITRRVQRRMTATDCPTIAQYSAFVQEHPDEEQQLLSSFLIKVTDFFRDQQPFAYLRDQILPQLIKQARARGTGLRVWSAGCATGEEAYTLALLIADLQENAADRVPVRIFATDLDSSAVAFARRGVYPANALKSVPPALVQRFFINVDGEYEVDKRVRESMLFGQHDLSQTPPFPHIDLLVCRNVLMYFTPELQRSVLEAFAFALRDGGYLMLGSAETTRPLPELFTVEQAPLKLFRRSGGPVASLPSQFSATTIIPSATEAVRHVRPARVFAPAIATALPSRPESSVRLGSFAAGIFIVDRRYDIRLINPAARRLLGIHGAAINEDLIHLVGDDLGPALRATIDTVFREGQATQIDEIAVRDMDGDHARFLTIAVVPDFDREGQGESAPRVMLTVTDVTHLALPRQAAEAASAARAAEVERLNDRLQRLEEANERLLAANEELAMNEEVLRASSEEAAAASAEAQAATEELETYAEELQATTEELETLNEELKATVEELTVSNADLDAHAQELTMEQRAVEDSREQLSTILTHLPEPVVIVDFSGREILTNTAYDDFRILLGGNVEARLRDASGEPISTDQSPLARAARGESFTMEALAQTGGATPRRFNVTGEPVMRREGEARRGIVVFRDVTDRVLVALGQEFISLATHELRTPLTAATAYIELLDSMLEGQNTNAQMMHIAQQALTAVRRLGDRIADLADVQSLQSGKLRLNIQPTDLAGAVRQVVEIGQMLAHAQRIALESPPGPMMTDVDPRRIEQVLTNLLTNAIAYAPETPRIDVRLRRSGDRAELQVEDFGPGIPAVDVPKIFSRFFQVERSTPASHHGLGLGLYLAKEIVDAHGGTIAVDSIEGKGTTFTITLPLAQPS